MVGIIGAMGVEIEALKTMIENPVSQKISGIAFTRGKIAGTDVVLAACGIGKVFAGICAEIMILRYSPDCIINTGVAGTLSSFLSIGNIAIASEVVQHDMDTTAIGDPPGLISGIDLVALPCDRNLVRLLSEAASASGFVSRVGRIATGDCFVADNTRKTWITETFDAIACDMEGAAIGQVCYINHVPFAALRAISDGANGDSPADYPTFLAEAAANSIQVLRRVLKAM